MPGSGLFKVPYENSLATEAYRYIWEDGSSSLHNLQIHVEVTAGDGTKLLFSPKLTLPGECVVIPTGLKYFNIEDIKIKMKTPNYAFSTGAGGMWIARPLMIVSGLFALEERVFRLMHQLK